MFANISFHTVVCVVPKNAYDDNRKLSKMYSKIKKTNISEYQYEYMYQYIEIKQV